MTNLQPNFQSLLDRLHDIKEKFDQEYENLISLIKETTDISNTGNSSQAQIEEFKTANSVYQDLSLIYEGLDSLWDTCVYDRWNRLFSWSNENSSPITPILINNLRAECKRAKSVYNIYNLKAKSWIRNQVENMGAIDNFVRGHQYLPTSLNNAQIQRLIDALKYAYNMNCQNLLLSTERNILYQYSNAKSQI